jgi:hypothetical protein
MRRGGLHFGLPLDPERVGEAHEVVEDADDMRGGDDRVLAPTARAEAVDVVVDNPIWRECQLLGVFQERTVAGLDRRGAKIRLDLLDERGIGALETEKLSVDFRSILAATGARRDDRDHLAFLPRERSGIPHDSLEELEEGPPVAFTRDQKSAHLTRELRVGVSPLDPSRRGERGGVIHGLRNRVDAKTRHGSILLVGRSVLMDHSRGSRSIFLRPTQALELAAGSDYGRERRRWQEPWERTSQNRSGRS